jgi:ADP-ribosylglycohydrolase
MRTAPVGVFLAGDPEALRAAALVESAITHYDPRCRLACAAFDAAIAAALQGPDDARALVAAARAELPAAGDALVREGGEGAALVAAAVQDLEEDLALAERRNPALYGRDVHLHRTQGFVRVAFRLAFWEALHAPTWEAALLDVVNRGGDADTNGAITGALLGALHGESAIPEAWRRRVLAAVPRERGPLRTVYHPRTLLRSLAPRAG